MLPPLPTSALRNDLHVETYIKAVLHPLLAGSTDDDVFALATWAKTHPEAIQEYRQTEREERQDRRAAGRITAPRRLTHRTDNGARTGNRALRRCCHYDDASLGGVHQIPSGHPTGPRRRGICRWLALTPNQASPL